MIWTTLFILVCAQAPATEKASVQIGEKLLRSTSLGTNGRSCVSCHRNGKGLEETSAYTDSELHGMINFCIRDALEGNMLPADSQELQSLFLYLRTLSPR